MMAKVPKFSNGKRGAALPVRVIPRASRNEVAEILSDQTVKIRLVSPPGEQETNEELIGYLSKILGVPEKNMEIVAGNRTWHNQCSAGSGQLSAESPLRRAFVILIASIKGKNDKFPQD
jgi:uncharacterized protein YggU (UPF0235/DUF167 family)